MLETLLLCAEIFCCRILDVSCSTLRTVLTVKEKTVFAALVGFFEASIWFIVVRQALTSDLGGLEIAVAYGGGFAAGTYIGGTIARRFIRSNIVVQVVTTERNDHMLHRIHEAGFAVTVVNANPSEFSGEKYLLFSEFGSARLKEFKSLIYAEDPKAFIMVQETKYVFNGFVRK